jgi:hypothetical protein
MGCGHYVVSWDVSSNSDLPFFVGEFIDDSLQGE